MVLNHALMSETKNWVLAISHLVAAALAKSALLAHPPELLVSEGPPPQHGEQAHKHHQVPAPQALHCSGWTKSKSGKFEKHEEPSPWRDLVYVNIVSKV